MRGGPWGGFEDVAEVFEGGGETLWEGVSPVRSSGRATLSCQLVFFDAFFAVAHPSSGRREQGHLRGGRLEKVQKKQEGGESGERLLQALPKLYRRPGTSL